MPPLRPELMWLDTLACWQCGLCEEVAPEIFREIFRVPVNAQTLEAMSVCPAGAIRWLEGKEEE